jgi:PEP-CTERM motif
MFCERLGTQSQKMSMYRWILLLVILVLPLSVQPARAEIGDVSFRVTSLELTLPAAGGAGFRTSVDAAVDIEGGGSVPAVGWGVVFEITPAAGSTGSVLFDPALTLDSEPNLATASVNPFIDFDRDFGGMSFGEIGQSPLELHAVAAYVPPLSTAPPALDAHGNVALLDGAGLASLPLLLSADAAGDFIISIEPNPLFAGVLFSTGAAAPDDIAIHPVGVHVAGTISIERLATLSGDYNGNGAVDAADYTVWRDTLGQTGDGLAADGDRDDMVDQEDYDIWKAGFGNVAGSGSVVTAASTVGLPASVPEPASLLLLTMSCVAAGLVRQRCPMRKSVASRRMSAIERRGIYEAWSRPIPSHADA